MAFVFDDIINGIFASNAAGQQQDQAQKAMDLQTSIYNGSKDGLNQYSQGGQQSFAQLLQGLQSGSFNQTVNPQTLVNDPGYQFRMQQAQQALQRSASAKGTLGSGGFAKSLDQYSQGLASQEYQQAFNNQQTMNNSRFSHLYDTSRMGLQGAQDYAGLGSNYANSMGQLYGAMGNAQAAGTMAWGNALSGSFQDVVNNGGGWLQSAAGGKLLNSGGGGGGGSMLGGYAPSMGMGGSSVLGAGSTAGAADAVGGAAGGGSLVGLAALA